jgi:hypothetical protein
MSDADSAARLRRISAAPWEGRPIDPADAAITAFFAGGISALVAAPGLNAPGAELRGLRWQDVELDRRENRVHQRAIASTRSADRSLRPASGLFRLRLLSSTRCASGSSNVRRANSISSF